MACVSYQSTYSRVVTGNSRTHNLVLDHEPPMCHRSDLLCTPLFLLLGLMVSDPSNAQSPLISSAIPVEASFIDVVVDDQGNSYVTGTFHGQADFDNITLTAQGDADAFIAKLGPGNNWIWANGFGGTAGAGGMAVAWDGAEGLYFSSILGGSQSLSYAGSVVGTCDSAGIAVVRVDTAGAFDRVTYAVASQLTWLEDMRDVQMAATPALLFLSGSFLGDQLTFGNIVVAGSEKSAFLAAMDPDGNWLWAKGFNTSEYSVSSGLQVDDVGDVILAGHFQGPALQLDSALLTGPPINVDAYTFTPFVVKWSASGVLLWAAQGTMGNTSDAQVVDLVSHPGGGHSVLGWSTDSAGFGPVQLTGGGAWFIAEITETGAWTSAVQPAIIGSFYLMDACSLSDGSILTGGYFGNTLILGGNVLVCSGQVNGVLAEFGTSDDWTVAEAETGPEQISVWGVVSNTDQIRAFGRIEGLATFGVDQVTLDGEDGMSFIATINGALSDMVDHGTGSATLTLFPVPVLNNVNVSLPGLTTPTRLTVTDVLGRTVLTRSINEASTVLDLSALPTGAYVLTIANRTARFVKE
jgi:hypothetical protein